MFSYLSPTKSIGARYVSTAKCDGVASFAAGVGWGGVGRAKTGEGCQSICNKGIRGVRQFEFLGRGGGEALQQSFRKEIFQREVLGRVRGCEKLHESEENQRQQVRTEHHYNII